MKIVIAIDSFKGSISSLDAAAALEKGFRQVLPEAEILALPIADGGEGTMEALLYSVGGEMRTETVTGPLGTPVEASWAALKNGTAVIEMAAASGLPLVPEGQRNPCKTTTYGTGELLRVALDAGYRRFVIGIGGSATNDGGAGLARALGVSFRDAAGRELPEGGLALQNLAEIDCSGLDSRLQESQVLVACDVTNPLLGPDGASAVYGPQKGATPEMVSALDAALARYADCLKTQCGKDVAAIPGAGAAGGLGAGLLAFCGAEMRSGIGLVLELSGLSEKLTGATLAITGEGRMDASSAYGKAPVGVAALAMAQGVPVVAFTGCLGPGYESLYEKGIGAILPIADGPMTVEASMANAAELLTGAAARAARLLTRL